MPLYIADYLRKTMHLNRDQHGGYLLLIMACWDRGGRLPNDPGQLAGIARATPAEWRRMAPVLLPFFETDGDWLIQGRVIEEHEKAQRLSETRRQAGAQGGRPKREGDRKSKPNAFANGNQTDSQNETHAGVRSSPSPSPDGEVSEAIASSVGSPSTMPTALELFVEEPSTNGAKPEPWEGDPDFLAAWKACTDQGRKRSSRAKAWPEWRRALKRSSGPSLAVAVARYVAQDEDAKRTGGPGFHLWLKDGRFEHWMIASGSGAVVTPICTFTGPAALRASVVEAADESFAVKFIDPAGWRPEDRTLIARNAYAAGEISRELRQWLVRMNVRLEIAPRASEGRAA